MEILSSRDVIGMFFLRLSQVTGMSWISLVSMLFTSDKESERYAWLGQVPGMREFIGGRHAKGLTDNEITIRNKEFEATLEIAVKDMRRDKTGQIQIRINELVDRTVIHWAQLLSYLIVKGHEGKCYDGSAFFSVGHKEGKNDTAQSNLIDVDISELAAKVHGSVIAPSAEEIQGAIMLGITKILSFKDNENEPMNELAQKFMVMVPPSLFVSAQKAIASPVIGGDSNVVENLKTMEIIPAANVRLDSWKKDFAVFRTDGNVKPFIRQEEVPVQFDVIAEGSELAFQHKKHHYGVYASRNVGYGYWQHACKVTMK